MQRGSHNELNERLPERLGYERYGAQGGDIGSGVSGVLSNIDHVVGAHINTDPLALALIGVPLPDEMSDLSEADKESLERKRQYVPEGKGYLQIQGTRPQTLAYGLNDSPAEQLAWIVEKFKEWTDPAADLPEEAVDRGGHFAAMEVPDLLVDDVRAFFHPLR